MSASLPTRDLRPPRRQMPIGSDTDSEDSSSEEEGPATQRASAEKKAEAASRRAKAHDETLAAQSREPDFGMLSLTPTLPPLESRGENAALQRILSYYCDVESYHDCTYNRFGNIHLLTILYAATGANHCRKLMAHDLRLDIWLGSANEFLQLQELNGESDRSRSLEMYNGCGGGTSAGARRVNWSCLERLSPLHVEVQAWVVPGDDGGSSILSAGHTGAIGLRDNQLVDHVVVVRVVVTPAGRLPPGVHDRRHVQAEVHSAWCGRWYKIFRSSDAGVPQTLDFPIDPWRVSDHLQHALVDGLSRQIEVSDGDFLEPALRSWEVGVDGGWVQVVVGNGWAAAVGVPSALEELV
ncbi:hypothetical protein AYL99_11925 [Fonsecaea erecta]|uniref:Uncharacterized protein n=1 Tax=Fonsecaea erecta TaxID=1367422 RepID=A0A178Z3X7_9EURO|nr:hypothetical protein AYL99_11925 [Fonsecaea erecta]OAP53903.1 hypothetical protein AYL99_11925 [Fonsecaea erecta]